MSETPIFFHRTVLLVPLNTTIYDYLIDFISVLSASDLTVCAQETGLMSASHPALVNYMFNFIEYVLYVFPELYILHVLAIL